MCRWNGPASLKGKEFYAEPEAAESAKRVLGKADGSYVLSQQVAEGFAVENDLLARILQVSLAPAGSAAGLFAATDFPLDAR